MPVAPKWQAVAFSLRPSSLAPFEPMNLLDWEIQNGASSQRTDG